MFERFVRLAKARKALKEGALEQALQDASDPTVAGHRRAEAICKRAVARLLGRAKERFERGQLILARADLSRILAFSPGHGEATSLSEEIDGRLGERKQGQQASAQLLSEARRMALAGDLVGARTLIDRAREGGGEKSAIEAETNFIRARCKAAGEHLEAAGTAYGRGDLTIAVRELAIARSLDSGPDAAAGFVGKLMSARSKELQRRAEAHIGRGAVESAWNVLREDLDQLPELLKSSAVSKTLDSLASVWLKRVQDLAGGDEDTLFAAVRQILGLDQRILECPRLAAALDGLEALERSCACSERGAFPAAASEVERAMKSLGWKVLGQRREGLRKKAIEVEKGLQRAKKKFADGEFGAVRETLTGILKENPMHEGARRELDILDRGMSDRTERLEQARQDARAGKLRGAMAQVVALAVPGAAGEEARLLIEEVKARMEMVDRGLDQVRVSLHGRSGASAEGVRHALARVRELSKVQPDHDEIPGLEASLEAELQALEQLEQAIHLALPEQRARVLAQVWADRGTLMREDRLDARILESVDELLACAEKALRGGRIAEAERIGRELGKVALVRGDVKRRVDALLEDAQTKRLAAAREAERAHQKLAERDFAGAEEALAEARERWADSPDVQRLEDEIRSLRRQMDTLGEVEELAREKEYVEAQRRMASLPPTPAALRTRVFDMKKDLARAQGLSGGFMLRVDEGGEFIVLRGDSLTIGNVRDRRSDLAVLANIKSRHARIERTLTFHGGMKDSIVSEDGEVRVNGRPVQRKALVSGDTFQLGSLKVTYSLPSSRSLTAVLALGGGFQVQGTDRVLMLKDRGRDGRILIGQAPDTHVRLPAATGEVEIFAHTNGQVRVRCPGSGTLGGKPFHGEHPVVAGEPVECCGVSFTLHPLVTPS